MAGNIQLKYAAASTAVTVTNLHSLAASASWLAGWTSNSVNNTSNNYSDYMWAGTFTTHASNRQAGTILVYVLAALNDTPTWTATASGTIGTEGALSFTAIEQSNSLARLVASIPVLSTASQIYTFPPTGIAQFFNGWVPPYHALYVTGNATTTTTAQFASSGSAIYYTPVIEQYT